MERRLAAILAADVVGYSRLMGEDEAGTLAALKSHRDDLIAPKVIEHHGRIVKLMGDGMLVEFPSVVEAVQCAVEFQRAIASRNAEVPEHRQIWFRVGVNLGDVIIEDDDIYGDGVNVAARLEELAQSGGIAVSGTVHEHIEHKLELRFEDLGIRALKNISGPVHVYNISGLAPAGAIMRDVPEGGIPAIVVLPFENLSDDPGQEYFCDGLTQDITTELSKFPNFFVIAAKSAFSYKNLPKRAEEIGRELRVRYILEGAIQRAGDHIRVNAQLVDAETGHHLWVRRFDKDLTDIFEIQEEVVELIIGSLAPKVTAVERVRATRRRFARAYGWLAYTYVTGHIDDWKFPKPEAGLTAAQRMKKARELADRAVNLAPRDYDTLWAKGFVRLHTGDARVAEVHFNSARALNYGNRELLAENADERVYAGHPDKAIELIMRARAIPDWHRWVLAWAYYFKARKEPIFYDMALQELQQLTEQPGQGRTPAEILILLAAIHGQKSGLPKNPRAPEDRERANKHRKAYEKLRKKRTLKDIDGTNPFRRGGDRQHWLSGLKAAGF